MEGGGLLGASGGTEGGTGRGPSGEVLAKLGDDEGAGPVLSVGSF